MTLVLERQHDDFVDCLSEDVSMPDTDPEYDAWFGRKVEAGLRDIQEGRVLTADEVDQRAQERIARFLALRAKRVSE
ncbi:MAG: hypothetical protein IJU76_02890 [Desulfovibrionaceae bacterium]|nr:hypothetical protein [Desulfovibrionaceae bacterium]